MGGCGVLEEKTIKTRRILQSKVAILFSIYYLNVISNSSIFVNNGSLDMRILANTNWNTTLCSQKPPVCIGLRQDVSEKRQSVQTGNGTQVKSSLLPIQFRVKRQYITI